jgi:KaiC/GvpD/RAD55 family RecA-like ATPase
MARTEIGVDLKDPILKKDRLSSGIDDFDIMLEGGYKNPANIMIVGPTGMEKNAFAYHFASAANSRKEVVLLICADAAPASVVKKAASSGIDLKGRNLFFIDCYSTTINSKNEPEATEDTQIVEGPGALNDLSLAINEIIKKGKDKKMRIVFDSLSTFVLYNPEDSIRKFLKIVGGRLKEAEATTIFLVEEGVHDKQLLSLLEHGMDSVFNIEEKNGSNTLRVPMIRMDIPFRIGPSGINIL